MNPWAEHCSNCGSRIDGMGFDRCNACVAAVARALSERREIVASNAAFDLLALRLYGKKEAA